MRHNTPKRAAETRRAIPARKEFARLFTRCWICGDRRLLAVHEITSGPARRWGFSHREAWLLVCCTCHADVIHDDWHCPDNIAMEYALKRLRDPDFYNRPLLNEARSLAPNAVSANDVRMATALVLEIVKW